MSTREIGASAESAAAAFLISQGMTLICKNFHYRSGEIDLIMQDGEYLVFVEVRYRQQLDYGDPASTISAQKIRRLIKTAQYYLVLSQKYDKIPTRFDVVALHQDHSPKHIQWIKNAIQSS